MVGTFSSNPVSGMGNPLQLGVSNNWWHAGGFVLALLVVAIPARRVIVTDEAPVEEPAVAPTHVEDRDATVVTDRPVEHVDHADHVDRNREPAMAAHTEHTDQAEPVRNDGMEPMPEVATNDPAAPKHGKHRWHPFNHRGTPDATPPGSRCTKGRLVLQGHQPPFAGAQPLRPVTIFSIRRSRVASAFADSTDRVCSLRIV